MRSTLPIICGAMILVLPALAQQGQIPIAIETEMGMIEAVIDVEHAPTSGNNFLKYVDAGLFNGGYFHRTVKPDNQPDNDVKIEVIQAARAAKTTAFPAIPLERTSVTGLHHKNGTLSMARSAPDSGTSDFSICVGDQPSLDFGGKRNPDGQGFAAFGQVTKGFDVIKKIQASPADGQKLTPRISILSIKRK